MIERPLMPKATAVWLVDNTLLTFDQIAAFTGLHPLEIQAIADGDVAANIVGKNPILRGFISQENLDTAQKDQKTELVLLVSDMPQVKRRAKGPKYTPVAKRADKPNGISYLLKTYADMTDGQIIRLIGTTKNTIEKIRTRTHANSSMIVPQDPIQLGLCKREELQAILDKNERLAQAKIEKAEKEKAKNAKKKAKAKTSAKSSTAKEKPESPVKEAPVADETSEAQSA